jgi:hypothetical protein
MRVHGEACEARLPRSWGVFGAARISKAKFALDHILQPECGAKP